MNASLFSRGATSVESCQGPVEGGCCHTSSGYNTRPRRGRLLPHLTTLLSLDKASATVQVFDPEWLRKMMTMTMTMTMMMMMMAMTMMMMLMLLC